MIISDPYSDFPESKIRNVIFEVIVKTKILKRFDTSHPFSEKFNARKPKRQKNLGLYEVERIKHPCHVTLAVNPKEHFEFFGDYSTNKNHKGIRKGSREMEFHNYANRIKSLKNFDTFDKPVKEYKEVGRFVVKKAYMVKTSVTKTKFSQLNDKRFYLPNGILSLPYGHASLEELEKFKNEQGQKIGKHFWQEKDNLLKMG